MQPISSNNSKSNSEANNEQDAKPKPKPNPLNLASLGLLLVLLAKGKGILIALLKMKGVATVMTMLFNIIAYWWYGKLGLPAAAGFVSLLLVHEMGHVLALRHYGIPATTPIFIPFVGAFVGMKQMPKDAWEEAIVAIAGPIVGSIGAALCLAVFLVSGAKLWLWLFAMGLILNLFNLIPCSPLDGGRVVGAVWRGFWVLGIAGMLWFAAVQKDFYLIFITVICLSELENKVVQSKIGMQFLWSFMTVACSCAAIAWQHPWSGLFSVLICLGHLWYTTKHWDWVIASLEPTEYCQLPLHRRVLMGSMYLLLVAILAAGLFWVNAIGALKIPH